MDYEERLGEPGLTAGRGQRVLVFGGAGDCRRLLTLRPRGWKLLWTVPPKACLLGLRDSDELFASCACLRLAECIDNVGKSLPSLVGKVSFVAQLSLGRANCGSLNCRARVVYRRHFIHKI